MTDYTDDFFAALDGLTQAVAEANATTGHDGQGQVYDRAIVRARKHARKLFMLAHGKPDPYAEGKLRELFSTRKECREAMKGS